MTYIYWFIIGSLCIKLYRVNEKKKIYYHNYQSCLLALSDFDPKLKEYLESMSYEVGD